MVSKLRVLFSVHVPQGGSMTVVLMVKPEAHTVVTSDAGGEVIYVASADVQIEQGDITLHVGGGQPDYYDGSLSATATVATAAALSSCDK